MRRREELPSPFLPSRGRPRIFSFRPPKIPVPATQATVLAPRKGIQGSLGFWIPRHGFRIICQWNLDSGFPSAAFRIPHQKFAAFRIPQERISRIPGSGFPYLGRSVTISKC